MIWAICLLLVGIGLSAFFSGSETGFYRVGRVRLALDARQGDPTARAMLWLTNNPSLFVATTLVGNNLANNLTTLAIVLVARWVTGTNNSAAELSASLAAAPFVFVYGELMPKSMFYLAPNRLLRMAGPIFVGFAVLFAPIAMVLWSLGWLLQYIMGASHLQVRQRLARGELQRILVEGHDAGILGVTQTQLANSVFDAANDRVTKLLTPVARFPAVADTERKERVIEMARRRNAAEVLVVARSREILGYIRFVDLMSHQGDWRDVTQHLSAIRHDDSQLTAVVRMQSRGTRLSEVVDRSGRTVGILSLETLRSALTQPR